MGKKWIQSIPQNSHTRRIVVHVPSRSVPPSFLESRVWNLIQGLQWGAGHTHPEFVEMNEWFCFWETPLGPIHLSQNFPPIVLRPPVQFFSFGRGENLLFDIQRSLHTWMVVGHKSQPLTTVCMWHYNLSFGMRVSYIFPPLLGFFKFSCVVIC